ncbi:hypothetical protein ECH_0583 [Ehrlichia chaffeensis str. Arkansas]|uniref:Uncharacterized protein n=1 Tax=Ehrlichia chaffeensis (strain ATCC CRL-10679 / Arkansas) TaxID=205920 RepID=Q2GGN9_EHRCR|nr:hypothetical protein ECH_0583 [Ehrlichia chaffeensis str. Arkansas]
MSDVIQLFINCVVCRAIVLVIIFVQKNKLFW